MFNTSGRNAWDVDVNVCLQLENKTSLKNVLFSEIPLQHVRCSNLEWRAALLLENENQEHHWEDARNFSITLNALMTLSLDEAIRARNDIKQKSKTCVQS